MIEVEIKASVVNFKEIKANFSKLNILLENKKNQLDIMFGQDRFLDNEHKLKEGSIMARIRKTDKKIVICFKEVDRGHAEYEAEFESPDLESAKRFLKKLDFEEAFEIEKLREIYRYKDFTICLDDVKELGKFIEIEKIINKIEEKEKSIQECKEMLNVLCPSAKIQTKKYGDLMQEIINERSGN